MEINEVHAATIKAEKGPEESDFKLEPILNFTRSKPFGIFTVVCTVCAVTGYVILSPDVQQDAEPQQNQLNDAEILAPQIEAQLPLLSTAEQLKEPAAAEKLEQPRRTGATRHAIPKVLAAPSLILRPHILKLAPGLVGKAILLTGASNGPVKAKLMEKLVQSGEEILEAGSVLLGTGNSGEDRLLIQFEKVLTPDGAVSKLKADALDSADKISGLKGSMAFGRSLQIAGSVGLNVLGGVADGLQENEAIGNQVAKKSTLKNAALNGTSKTALEEARNLMSGFKDNTPAIEVPAGKEFLVLFQGTEENH